MSFAIVAEELRLGTDAQTLLRSHSHSTPETSATPREEVLVLIELPDRPDGGEQLISAVFQVIKDICFRDQGVDPYERFEMALKEANAIIAEFRDQQHAPIGRVNAVMGFVSGRELHLTQAGEAEGYLIRGGTLTTVTEGLSPDAHAVDIFVNIASGQLDAKDKLVFATERLLRYATKTELVKVFSPLKGIGLALEELDEIIVLEGAQTTGVLAVDVTSTSRAAAATARSSSLASDDLLGQAQRYMDRGLAFVRERIPEGTKIPDMPVVNIDKNYLILGFLVAVIGIVLSISWSLGTSSNQVKMEEIQQVLAEAQSHVDEAKLRRNIGDKATAYTELQSAEQLVDDLIATGVAVEEAIIKREEIAALRDELDNIRRYSGLTPVADIASVVDNPSLVGLADLRGRTIAYGVNDLFDIALDTINGPVTIDDVSAVRAAKYFDDRDAVVFLTADGKVIEWRDGEPVIMDTADTTWRTGVDVSTYSSFIYILDPVNNQIWKYLRQRDAYGSGEAYSENADLTQAVSIAIDGDVWVLAADGDDDMGNDIIRIRRGERRPLSIQDLPEGSMTDPAVIFTNEDLRYIYVLDRGDNRVLRFYKDPPEPGSEARSLVYGTQYRFDDLPEIRDIYVDSGEQKMTLVTADSVYEVSI